MLKQKIIISCNNKYLVTIIATVTGQRQTLIVGRPAHFFLAMTTGTSWLEESAPTVLRSFQRSNVPVNFFEFLPTESAACSEPPSRDNSRKAFYPRTHQRNQGAG